MPQQISNYSILKADSTLKVGKLNNGFTYHLKVMPSPQIEIRFVVRAGAQDEEKNQKGIAHLIEHLAFRESKHFPNGTRAFLQEKGLRNGKDIGGSTGDNTTVYSLTIPSGNNDLLISSLRVIKDWSRNLSFRKSSIKSEYGIIKEEERLGFSNSDFRIQNRIIEKVLFYNKINESIHFSIKPMKKFKKKDLLKFYEDWYRPDLFGIFIIGTFDLEKAETEIINKYSDLLLPAKVKEKISFPKMILTGENQFEIISDPDKANTVLQILYKKKGRERSHFEALESKFLCDVYNLMINGRLASVKENFKLPYWQASSELRTNDFVPDLQIDVLSISITLNNTDQSFLKFPFFEIMREFERIRRFGFTHEEFLKAKSRVTTHFIQKNKTESPGNFIEKYANEFGNESYKFLDDNYETSNAIQKIIENVTLEKINQLLPAWISEKDRSTLILTNDTKREEMKSSLDSIPQWFNEVRTQTLTNIQKRGDRTKSIIRKEDLPIDTGRNFTVSEDRHLGVLTVLLENGTTIHLKPVKNPRRFKNSVFVVGISPGGTSLYPQEEDLVTLNFTTSIIEQSGFRDIERGDLEEIMEEKRIRVHPYINSHFEGIKGFGKIENFESIMQLFYKYIKNPFIDVKSQDSWIGRKLDEHKKDMHSLGHKVDSVKNPHSFIVNEKSISQISFLRVLEIYRERFSNISDFTFFISGDFESKSLLPLINKYFGSLERNDKKEQFRNSSQAPIPSQLKYKFESKSKNNVSKVELYLSGKYEYSLINSIQFSTINEILSQVLTERLREKEKGVYYCLTSLETLRNNGGIYTFKIVFECDPKNSDRLISAVKAEIAKLRKTGPQQHHFDIAIGTLNRTYAEDIQNPEKWMNYFVKQFESNSNLDEILSWKELINTIRKEGIKEQINKFLKEELLTQIIILQ